MSKAKSYQKVRVYPEHAKLRNFILQISFLKRKKAFVGM